MDQNAPSVDLILAEAVEIDSQEERQFYVEQACAGNEALRAHVEQLIVNYFRAGSFLELPPAELLDLTAAYPRVDGDATVGGRIGPYKILEQIGEGGMGLVYVAEQQHPLRRTVALKVIKPGMDSKQVVARFEAERQALALMDHPNISKILDAGTTESGRPYFVMDLVHGISILEYCDQARLTVRQRLDLFVQVARAVQHAHTKGIIHRDLKPSNVLVTSHDGVPVPMVIDFGVAKALGQQLTTRTLYTGFAQMVGTPLYMSPEQAEFNQLGVDTRSDVYSLGVLLYELLTGTTPFERERFRGMSYDEMRHVLREEEPPRPSTRISTLGAALTTISERRGVDGRHLTRSVRGELDWIVMKALEKDRTRRYESASAFAADVQRFLDDESVEACPPTPAYRARKFVRRYRIRLTIAATIAFAFVVVSAVIGWVANDRHVRQTVLKREVEAAKQEAYEKLGQDHGPAAMAALQRGEALLRQLEERSDSLTAVRADLEMVERLNEIRLQMASYSEDSFNYRGADLAYAQAFREYGIDLAEMEPADAVAAIRERPIRLHLTTALDHWADARRIAGTATHPSSSTIYEIARNADPDEWRTRLRAALERRDRDVLVNLTDSPTLAELPATTKCLLGQALGRMGETNHAVRHLWKAQIQHPSDFWINFELAFYRARMKPARPDEVVRFYTAAQAIRPSSAAVSINLGIALHAQGKPGPALAVYRQAIRLDPSSAIANYHLARLLKDQSQLEEATAAYREALRLKPGYVEALVGLGVALAEAGMIENAIAAFRQAIRLDEGLAMAHYNLGLALKRNGAMEEAVASFRTATRLQPTGANGFNNLGNALAAQGKLPEAIDAFREAIRLQPDYALAHNNLGNALRQDGQLPDAIRAYREAIRVSPDYAAASHNLGVLYCRSNDPAAAIQVLEAALERGTGDKAWACAHSFVLAMAYHQAGKPEQARTWFERGEKLSKSVPKPEVIPGLSISDLRTEAAAFIRPSREPNHSK